MDAYLRGVLLKFSPTSLLGKGGEADVYQVGTEAIKIFKQPDHPDYTNNPNEQKGAAERIKVHQQKLRVFPKNLPPNVVGPKELVTDKSGKIILGYAMNLIDKSLYEVLMQFTDYDFRKSGGINNASMAHIVKNMWATVKSLHSLRIVLGDFNDLNVLVNINSKDTKFIDADSMQFGSFLCKVFTNRFVDPTLCELIPNPTDPSNTIMNLAHPHNEMSDWYGFNVIVFQGYLLVDPFGGILKGKVPHNRRPIEGLSIMGTNVIYPKPYRLSDGSPNYRILPDELLHHFDGVFQRKVREEFPQKLLNLEWIPCGCGLMHARSACPVCQKAVPGVVKQTIAIKGQVMVTTFFKTKGIILYSTFQNNKLLFLYHENNNYFREDGRLILNGALDPQIRYRIKDSSTLLGKHGTVVQIDSNSPNSYMVESFGSLPMFDTNNNHVYLIRNGELSRTSARTGEYIGTIMRNQTLFWVGDRFGFGFYRAGNISIAFVFDAERPKSMNDSVSLEINGKLIDSTCYFSSNLCWFFYSSKISGRIIHHCAVISSDGLVLARTSAERGSESWLDSLRGKCAFKHMLFVPTDTGLKRVEFNGGKISVVRDYPDTEPFIQFSDHLFLNAAGELYVVSDREVSLLKIN